ncbi:MAG: DEAD/DEAH box helicase [Leeuwenhoekiella sp.]
MKSFEEFKIKKPLKKALANLGFQEATAIQEEAFAPIRSGGDVVGIAQTGTGKTLAYTLPLLADLDYSDQEQPRVLILVPTRELVLQVAERISQFAEYTNTRVAGVYGGVTISKHKEVVTRGCDILIGTPGRINDLILSRTLRLKAIKKVVVDEVDLMLDLGFRPQLVAIFDMLPSRRQHILFSATMTDEVSYIIEKFLHGPLRITVASSGTPIDTITQRASRVKNFYTKINLLKMILADAKTYGKVLVFAPNKRNVERINEELAEELGSVDVIHGNKSQNYRINALQQFENGETRILIATDVMARGIDLTYITHVISMDVPNFPENYMHRIGRTGRAGASGNSILLYTDQELDQKEAIEQLMGFAIEEMEPPQNLEIASRLLPEERTDVQEINNPNTKIERGKKFHDKKEKNQKVNLGGKYKREIEKKYKKPKTRGDKNYNRRKKR